MAFKLPGIMRSPAFQVGAFKEINVRYDRMAENADKYKAAAMTRGQELFAEHKNTKDRLKTENEAKQYVAAQFTPELADWLDSTGELSMTAGLDKKEFFARIDETAKNAMTAGGVPADFQVADNPYYGDQRFEEYGQSYDKVKNFMDTNNNVFGNSFGMLMEENTPEKMTREQFGVRAREDITSLRRTGLGATEIKTSDEKALYELINQTGGWSEKNKSITFGPEGQTIVDWKGVEGQIVNASKKFASQHYRYNQDRSSEGAQASASIGIAIAKRIAFEASTTKTLETSENDLKNIWIMMKEDLPALGNITEGKSAFTDAVNLYILSAKESGSPISGGDLREKMSEISGFKIYPTFGLVIGQGGGGSGGIQSKQYVG